MFKIIRGCIRCDKGNRWKTWILSFSRFHQMVTGRLTCRKKRKFENWTSSLSLWFKWELSLCASRWNTKRTLGPYFLQQFISKTPRTIFWERNHLSLYQIMPQQICCVKVSWHNFWWFFKISAWFHYQWMIFSQW